MVKAIGIFAKNVVFKAGQHAKLRSGLGHTTDSPARKDRSMKAVQQFITQVSLYVLFY